MMEPRQIEHSRHPSDSAVLLDRLLMRAAVFLLCESEVSIYPVSQSTRSMYVLVSIGFLLPHAVTLNSHADASKDHLLAAPKVNAQLHKVPIADWIRLGLDIRLAEPDVIQERAAA